MYGSVKSIVVWATAAIVATGAHAEWQQAKSRHFIVYADDSPTEVRSLVERLERFDSTQRVLQQLPEDSFPPANRVSVYVLNGGQDAIMRLYGRSNGVAGFYIPRATGSVAFTPKKIGNGAKFGIDPQGVLFHEYGHHFLLGQSNQIYPQWYSEGYAEFVGSVRFGIDHVMIGAPPYHRAEGLIMRSGVSMDEMFSPDRGKIDVDSLYGRGWVLTHMAYFDATRWKQLTQFLKLLNTGTPAIEAGKQAFGDLQQLQRAMDAYISKPVRTLRIPFAKLASPEVTVRTMTPGENAMIGFRMASERGVDRKAAANLYAQAAPVAARYPADSVVQGWLSEMAFDSGRDDDAEAAADRALAADPNSMQALLYKGRVRLRRAAAVKATDKVVWAEARSWVLRANQLDRNEAAPLVLFYESFALAGQAPTPSAVKAINQAMELVPQDRSVRLLVAQQALGDGKVEEARAALRPAAYGPHTAPDNVAAKALAVLDKEGASAALSMLRGTPKTDATDDGKDRK